MRLRPFFLLLTLLLLRPAAAEARGPQQVKVGVYLMNLYSLNMDEHSFYADFYIWFRWKGSLDPTKFEFVNSIEKWSMNQAAFDGDSTPVKLKDGSFYKIYRVEARFFHTFLMDHFPLDRHELDIQIENPEYPVDSLVYTPDTSGAAIRQTLNLVGWNLGKCRLESTVHDYGSNFGNSQENAQRYSNLSFVLPLERPLSYFLLKMLLPLIVVMLVSIGALFLHPSHIDTRSSLPIGGLLTAVFLQQMYGDALPDSGSMVLMDKIYLLAYVLISLVLWQMIVAGNWLTRKEPPPDAAMIRRERQLAFLYIGIFFAGIAVLCLW